MSTVLFSPGTAIVWGHSGGSGVTKDIALDALGAGAAREGDYADLGSTFPEWLSLWLWAETGTAPTANEQVECWLNWSHNSTDWSGGGTGADAAFTIGTNDANLRLVGQGSRSATCMVTATANTLFKAGPFSVRARARYVSPIVVNRFGTQTLRDHATASDHASRVIIVPLTPTF